MWEVSLVDYVGQSVYIVFCNVIFSGDVLLIDDIIIIEGEISSVVEVDNVVFEFNFVFNLVIDVGIVLQYMLEQVADVVISIQDMSGCQVQELCQGCFCVGCYNVQLEMSSLLVGVYVVSVCMVDKVGIMKFIV